MSDEVTKEEKVESDSEAVVLEKQNYLRMMSTIRWLLALSLGLGIALTVTTVKLLNTRKSG
jgi:hypothetical protein